MKRAARYALTLYLCSSALASAAEVSVTDAWVRATAPGQNSSAAYMQLRSAAGGAVLSVTTPVAASAEIHEMRMDRDVMRMRPVGKLELPSGKSVLLRPGGLHLMLSDVKRPLRPGDSVPLSLQIRGKDNTVTTVNVNAEVRSFTAPAASHGAMKH